MPISSITRPSARGLAFAALLVLSACGSSDEDDSGASGGDDGSSSAPSDDASTDSDTDDASAPDTSSGDGTGTLTMADGTVYEFELRDCDTVDTDPATILLAGGYTLSGPSSDGEFRFTLARLGFDDEVAVATGSLEGDFDENGKNEKMLYKVSRESLDLIAVDGGNVSGEVAFSAIGPTRPHGDDTTATVEANC